MPLSGGKVDLQGQSGLPPSSVAPISPSFDATKSAVVVDSPSSQPLAGRKGNLPLDGYEMSTPVFLDRLDPRNSFAQRTSLSLGSWFGNSLAVNPIHYLLPGLAQAGDARLYPFIRAWRFVVSSIPFLRNAAIIKNGSASIESIIGQSAFPVEVRTAFSTSGLAGDFIKDGKLPNGAQIFAIMEKDMGIGASAAIAGPLAFGLVQFSAQDKIAPSVARSLEKAMPALGERIHNPAIQRLLASHLFVDSKVTLAGVGSKLIAIVVVSPVAWGAMDCFMVIADNDRLKRHNITPETIFQNFFFHGYGAALTGFTIGGWAGSGIGQGVTEVTRNGIYGLTSPSFRAWLHAPTSVAPVARLQAHEALEKGVRVALEAFHAQIRFGTGQMGAEFPPLKPNPLAIGPATKSAASGALGHLSWVALQQAKEASRRDAKIARANGLSGADTKRTGESKHNLHEVTRYLPPDHPYAATAQALYESAKTAQDALLYVRDHRLARPERGVMVRGFRRLEESIAKARHHIERAFEMASAANESNVHQMDNTIRQIEAATRLTSGPITTEAASTGDPSHALDSIERQMVNLPAPAQESAERKYRNYLRIAQSRRLTAMEQILQEVKESLREFATARDTYTQSMWTMLKFNRWHNIPALKKRLADVRKAVENIPDDLKKERTEILTGLKEAEATIDEMSRLLRNKTGNFEALSTLYTKLGNRLNLVRSKFMPPPPTTQSGDTAPQQEQTAPKPPNPELQGALQEMGWFSNTASGAADLVKEANAKVGEFNGVIDKLFRYVNSMNEDLRMVRAPKTTADLRRSVDILFRLGHEAIERLHTSSGPEVARGLSQRLALKSVSEAFPEVRSLVTRFNETFASVPNRLYESLSAMDALNTTSTKDAATFVGHREEIAKAYESYLAIQRKISGPLQRVLNIYADIEIQRAKGTLTPSLRSSLEAELGKAEASLATAINGLKPTDSSFIKSIMGMTVPKDTAPEDIHRLRVERLASNGMRAIVIHIERTSETPQGPLTAHDIVEAGKTVAQALEEIDGKIRDSNTTPEGLQMQHTAVERLISDLRSYVEKFSTGKKLLAKIRKRIQGQLASGGDGDREAALRELAETERILKETSVYFRQASAQIEGVTAAVRDLLPKHRWLQDTGTLRLRGLPTTVELRRTYAHDSAGSARARFARGLLNRSGVLLSIASIAFFNALGSFIGAGAVQKAVGDPVNRATQAVGRAAGYYPDYLTGEEAADLGIE